jgi:hypothetical protein
MGSSSFRRRVIEKHTFPSIEVSRLPDAVWGTYRTGLPHEGKTTSPELVQDERAKVKNESRLLAQSPRQDHNMAFLLTSGLLVNRDWTTRRSDRTESRLKKDRRRTDGCLIPKDRNFRTLHSVGRGWFEWAEIGVFETPSTVPDYNWGN